MKICCLADLHGYLPDIPPCDLLLLAGDYSARPDGEAYWLEFVFHNWLKQQTMPIIAVAGNHDIAFQEKPNFVKGLKFPWIYLEDSETIFQGLKIYGSPWQPYFYDWAFNLYEPDLEKKWELIPTDTDILLLHGPPAGYGDLTIEGVKTGSPSLTKKIEEIKPKLVVCGHIHFSYGQYQLGDTIIVNAAHCGENYKPVNKPIVIDI